MKNAAEYSRRIRQLFNKVRRDAGKHAVQIPEHPTHIMLLGVLANYTTEPRAAIGLERILTGTVDLNDLRVTPVADIVAMLGDFPRSRPAAEEVVSVLNSVFNHTHDLDLSFLGSMARKAAVQFLAGLDGASPHAIAYFRRQYLEEHIVPLDDNMRACLVRLNCLPDSATSDEVTRFVANVIKDREAVAFYGGLKKYAASHAPRGGKARQAAPESSTPEKPSRSPEVPSRAPAAAKTESRPRAARPARAGAATGAKKARTPRAARAKRAPTKKK